MYITTDYVWFVLFDYLKKLKVYLPKHREQSVNRSCFNEGTLYIADCGDPTPSNGNATLPVGTTYGSTALISCNDGYAIQGIQYLACLGEGQWSSQPTCIRGNNCNVCLTAHESYKQCFSIFKYAWLVIMNGSIIGITQRMQLIHVCVLCRLRQCITHQWRSCNDFGNNRRPVGDHFLWWGIHLEW